MKKIVAVALTWALALASLSLPVSAQAAQASGQTTGAVSGGATSNTGRPLPGTTIQLRNAAGAVVGSTVTGSDGKFTFAGLNAGLYTLECLGSKKEVTGTAKVNLTLPSATQNMTCANDTVGLPILSRKVLTALGAAAVAIGAVAVVATRPDGSPAQ
jgi:hypothetical protein